MQFRNALIWRQIKFDLRNSERNNDQNNSWTVYAGPRRDGRGDLGVRFGRCSIHFCRSGADHCQGGLHLRFPARGQLPYPILLLR